MPIPFNAFQEACKSAEVSDEVVGGSPACDLYKEAYPKIESLIDRLVGPGEPYIFVSERGSVEGQNHEALWAFSDDLAFVAFEAGGVTIAIYNPSRDFLKVEVAEINTDKKKRLIVKVEGLKELHASGDNRKRLYGALPYLLGRKPKAPAATGETPRSTEP